MKIAIVGYGKQGQSACEYWSGKGHHITVCDADEKLDLPDDVGTRLGPTYLKNLGEFDLIVRTPIVHPRDIATANDGSILKKVTTNTNEFFKVCPSKNIIGITGTKGKGTTSTLIAKMLEAAGKTVHLGGNIGTPPLELLQAKINREDWVVLELANFQLIDIKYAPHLAVCVMVASEHLDWHKDQTEYIQSKKQLFIHQKPQDIAIYYTKSELSWEIASLGPAKKIPYYAPPGAIVENDDIVIDGQSVCSTDEIKLPGHHNWQNICAAVTATWQVTKDVQAMRRVATTFGGLEHRLELVRELDGVKYYNDSFGTTPETAMVAIKAFKEPKIVILGGSDKGSSYDELAEVVAGSGVKKTLLIGKMASNIRQVLDKAGFSDYIDGGDSIEEIVENARANSEAGDVILFSPACASFDMFKNYEDRGNKFKAAVQALS